MKKKKGNVLVAKELARLYADKGIVSTSLNPGNLKTELQRHMSSIQERIVVCPYLLSTHKFRDTVFLLSTSQDFLLYPAPLGALTQLYAGVAPEAQDLNGAYLIPWARVGDTRADAKDPKTAEELWKWLEDQVKDI